MASLDDATPVSINEIVNNTSRLFVEDYNFENALAQGEVEAPESGSSANNNEIEDQRSMQFIDDPIFENIFALDEDEHANAACMVSLSNASSANNNEIENQNIFSVDSFLKIAPSEHEVESVLAASQSYMNEEGSRIVAENPDYVPVVETFSLMGDPLVEDAVRSAMQDEGIRNAFLKHPKVNKLLECWRCFRGSSDDEESDSEITINNDDNANNAIVEFRNHNTSSLRLRRSTHQTMPTKSSSSTHKKTHSRTKCNWFWRIIAWVAKQIKKGYNAMCELFGTVGYNIHMGAQKVSATLSKPLILFKTMLLTMVHLLMVLVKRVYAYGGFTASSYGPI